MVVMTIKESKVEEVFKYRIVFESQRKSVVSPPLTLEDLLMLKELIRNVELKIFKK